MHASLIELKMISQAVGCLPEFIQGGGGNTSIKLDYNFMAIKASGYELKKLTELEGYTVLNYVNVANYFNAPSNSEDEVTAAILKEVVAVPTIKKSLRPSIEAGFHAILKAKCILHTHSIYANILTCSKEGSDIIRTLFPESYWIEYYTPGRELTLQFKNKQFALKESPIIFMKNHGLIVGGDTADEVLKTHAVVNQTIKEYFKITEPFMVHNIPIDMDYMKEHVLFPDQVVYTSSVELVNTSASQQTLASYGYIQKQIEKNGLTPSYIPKEKIDVILMMESERYRRKMVQ